MLGKIPIFFQLLHFQLHNGLLRLFRLGKRDRLDGNERREFVSGHGWAWANLAERAEEVQLHRGANFIDSGRTVPHGLVAHGQPRGTRYSIVVNFRRPRHCGVHQQTIQLAIEDFGETRLIRNWADSARILRRFASIIQGKIPRTSHQSPILLALLRGAVVSPHGRHPVRPIRLGLLHRVNQTLRQKAVLRGRPLSRGTPGFRRERQTDRQNSSTADAERQSKRRLGAAVLVFKPLWRALGWNRKKITGADYWLELRKRPRLAKKEIVQRHPVHLGLLEQLWRENRTHW